MRPITQSLFLSAIILCAGVACSHVQVAPKPLYPGEARPADQVAVLSGPVAKVDNVEIDQASAPAFTLLPGCHVVELRSKIGQGGVSGAWSADLHHVIYAFRMKAGNNYSIDVDLQPGATSVGTGTVGDVKINAVESDAKGKKLASVARVKNMADIEACQAWKP